MNEDMIAFSAEPALTRLIYLKTALIIFGLVLLFHVGGQWRTTPLIDYRISLVFCLIFGLLALYGLTRSPLTQKLKIDYHKQEIVIAYMTLTKPENVLEIPFEHLRVNIDTSFGVTGNGLKWKAILLRDNQEKYSLSDREQGFSEAQLNEFIEKVKALAMK